MAGLRLDKILADTGRWSRKEARELIRRGCVTVDGEAALSAETRYDAEQISLAVNGESIRHETYTYIMMNKPAGVISATNDRRQKTVLDLLSPELQRRGLFPVGRLDRDTTGLLLLTNHGELAHRLLSPAYHVEKVYLAHTLGAVDAEDRAAFEQGMLLADGEQCMPARLTGIDGEPDCCLVTLREGKYHQVKRMLAARGKPVLSLKRLSMGGLTLDESLGPGEYRPLTAGETGRLFESVKSGTSPTAD